MVENQYQPAAAAVALLFDLFRTSGLFCQKREGESSPHCDYNNYYFFSLKCYV